MLILGIFIFWLIPVAVLLWIENSIRIEYRSDRIPILLYHRLISKELVEKGQVPDEERQEGIRSFLEKRKPDWSKLTKK